MSDDWPFADPKNVAVFTLVSITDKKEDIVRVTHDDKDGAWQFLDARGARMDDVMVVSLESVTHLDPTVLELADLPFGWCAVRERRGAPWQREKMQ
jgi:hypothetical protein